MKNNLPKLRPCPFCGQDVKLRIYDAELAIIACPPESKCQFTSLMIFIKLDRLLDGIDAWNNRKT